VSAPNAGEGATPDPSAGPATPKRVPALIVTHADLAQALVRAAERVVGTIEDVTLLSNEGLSRDDLEDAIETRVKHWQQGGLLLTDFWGGSCHTCGATAARRHGEVVIVTGVNLPLLLDYLHNRDRLSALELAERLQQKGRDSIRVQRGVPA
jgi:mannose/fructose-specific phosphotransferase system component IIA